MVGAADAGPRAADDRRVGQYLRVLRRSQRVRDAVDGPGDGAAGVDERSPAIYLRDADARWNAVSHEHVVGRAGAGIRDADGVSEQRRSVQRRGRAGAGGQMLAEAQGGLNQIAVGRRRCLVVDPSVFLELLPDEGGGIGQPVPIFVLRNVLDYHRDDECGREGTSAVRNGPGVYAAGPNRCGRRPIQCAGDETQPGRQHIGEAGIAILDRLEQLRGDRVADRLANGRGLHGRLFGEFHGSNVGAVTGGRVDAAAVTSAGRGDNVG